MRARSRVRLGRLAYPPPVHDTPPRPRAAGAALEGVGGGKDEVDCSVCGLLSLLFPTPGHAVLLAKFFTFLSQTPLQAQLHEQTGYLPITKAAYDAVRESGFYKDNPGRDIPVIQMTGKPPTENSRGLRLGNLVQIRDVIAEELESAFSGRKEAKAALDDAVNRGNGLLRQFQKNVQ